MRIAKDAYERKHEILDTAEELFMQNGYEKTSVQGIIDKIGIAKGTFYYYFKSKEELLNGIVDRYNGIIIERAQKIAEDKEQNCMKRFLSIISSMQIAQEVNPEVMEQIHTQKNLLLHQKTMSSIIYGLTPILTQIVEEGIAEGIFHTDFPKESVEMLLIYGLTLFDSGMFEFGEEEKVRKMAAIFAAGELLFGVQPGGFSNYMQ